MNPLNILLVDDSKSARYALRLQLQQHNMKVETADAAESALERVRESPPDVIFMDHTMPGMSGFEALDILKGSPSTAHIPVIMCTSHEDPEFLAQAKKKGALDILSKAAAGEKLGQLLDRLQQGTAAAGRIAATAAASPQAEGLDERIRILVEALMNERVEALATDLLARIHEQIDARARAIVEPFVEDAAERLTSNLLAKTDERLVSGLNVQAERLSERFLAAQNEQPELAVERLLDERLPVLLQEHFEQGERELERRAQQRIEGALDDLAGKPSFLGRVKDAVEVGVSANAEQVARHQAAEISERVAAEWTDKVAGLLAPPPKMSSTRIYLLSAGAAFTGILSAAVVFLLLR